MDTKGSHINAMLGLIGGITKFFMSVTLPTNFWSAFVGATMTGIGVTIVSFFTNTLLKYISRRIKRNKTN